MQELQVNGYTLRIGDEIAINYEGCYWLKIIDEFEYYPESRYNVGIWGYNKQYKNYPGASSYILNNRGKINLRSITRGSVKIIEHFPAEANYSMLWR